MPEPKFKAGQKVRAIDSTENFDVGTILTIETPDDPDRGDFYIILEDDIYEIVHHRCLFEAVPETVLEHLERRLNELEKILLKQ